MKRTRKDILILMISVIMFSGCCAFKKGSWKPLPSCKHLENAEHNDEKKDQRQSRDFGRTESEDEPAKKIEN